MTRMLMSRPVRHDLDGLLGLFSEACTSHLDRKLIPSDIKIEGDNLVVRAEIPGTSINDIKVQVKDNLVSINASKNQAQGNESDTYFLRERYWGSMERTLRLPEKIDADRSSSTYKDGVLEIVLPKKEISALKQIPIT